MKNIIEMVSPKMGSSHLHLTCFTLFPPYLDLTWDDSVKTSCQALGSRKVGIYPPHIWTKAWTIFFFFLLSGVGPWVGLFSLRQFLAWVNIMQGELLLVSWSKVRVATDLNRHLFFSRKDWVNGIGGKKWMENPLDLMRNRPSRKIVAIDEEICVSQLN